MIALAANTVQAIAPVATNGDAEVIGLWLGRKRSAHTRRAYTADLAEFSRFTGGLSLHQIRMSDMQAFALSLGTQEAEAYAPRDGRSPATHARVLASVKSLLGFACRIGYLPANVGQAVELPHFPDTLAERILSEEETLRLLHAETDPRNRALLRVLYSTGARVSEVCGLEWRHVKPAADGGAYVALYGKGGKSRTVRVSAATAAVLAPLRGEAGEESPVFKSRKGGTRLDVSQVRRIVQAAATRAGIPGKVSPHWLRHCCASHSLDRGCSIAVVQQTLGHADMGTTARYTHVKPNDSAGMHLAI